MLVRKNKKKKKKQKTKTKRKSHFDLTPFLWRELKYDFPWKGGTLLSSSPSKIRVGVLTSRKKKMQVRKSLTVKERLEEKKEREEKKKKWKSERNK